MMDSSSKNHTFSWIYNWCIWKTYWEIVFQKFENCEDEEKQIEVFTKHLNFYEHLHLMYSIYTQSKNHTLDTVSEQTEHFHFYSLENKQNGVVGNKVVKKRGSKNSKNHKKWKYQKKISAFILNRNFSLYSSPSILWKLKKSENLVGESEHPNGLFSKLVDCKPTESGITFSKLFYVKFYVIKFLSRASWPEYKTKKKRFFFL